MRDIIILVICLYAMIFGGSASADTIQVFLQAGQSNCVGNAPAGGLPAQLRSAQTDVKFYFGQSPTQGRIDLVDSDLQWLDLKPGSGYHFGPEILFGRTMADALSNPKDQVAIIKYGHGGTGFVDTDSNTWHAGGDATAKGDGNVYQEFQKTVNMGMQSLRAANPDKKIEIVGMIWVQGEQDAQHEPDDYESDLKAFFADVRLTYGADLPIVISQLSDNQTRISAVKLKMTKDVQARISAADTDMEMVTTDGYEVKRDNIHFNASAQISLGTEMAKRMIGLLSASNKFHAPEVVQGDLSIIPRPQEIVQGDGFLILNRDTVIIAGDETGKAADQLQSYLLLTLGKKIAVSETQSANSIRLQIVPEFANELESEGYRLSIDCDGVHVSAANEAGLFYGIQTLRQMMPVLSKEETVGTDQIKLPFVNIKDKPRFAWRAFMLDESRYFKGEQVVKSLLDQMALHKMNVFHWHLTDNQGWRIEIKKYPRLTEIGSKREDSQIGGWGSKNYSGEPHAGFYTQEQIREIVKYASDRHIKIVPEIEMPGHVAAAVASYSWLGASGRKIEVPGRFGRHLDVYNVADPKVVQFIQDVLIETMELFPSEVIHIGGDEVSYDHWKESQQINEYMTEHGIKTPADLQIFFTNRISRFIESKGRRMMGWNDILGHKLHDSQDAEDTQAEQKLAESTLIHFWAGSVELAEEAASQGYNMVNSHNIFTYLDYGYNSIPLKKAYSFDPIPSGLDSKYHSNVKGLGCQMWGEWIPTVEKMEKQIFPRLSAYAEVGWTRKNRKDFHDFSTRLEKMKQRWDHLDIQYHTD